MTGLNVAVLVQPGFFLMDAMGPLNAFGVVRDGGEQCVNLTTHEWHEGACAMQPRRRLESVHLLAPGGGTVPSSDGVRVQVDGSLEQPPRAAYDLLVVPAGADGPSIAEFVQRHYEAGGDVMSVCTGAVVLARLGLLDGRDATTNSLFLWRERRDFPAVRWISLRDRTDRRFVVSQPPLRLVTTAGVSAGIDGALHYIDAWFGRSVAEATREYLEWPLPLEAALG